MNQLPNEMPNRFPLKEDSESGTSKRSSSFRMSDINWKGIILVAVLIVAGFVGWVIIRDLSQLGGSFGSYVSKWFNSASIYPKDQSGFVNFLRLIGIGGLIGLLLVIFKRN